MLLPISLDSAQVARYINDKILEDSVSLLLRNFYNSRNYQLAWFTEDGVAEQTQAFYNLHRQYINEFKDSTLMFPSKLQAEMEQLLFLDTVITQASLPLAEIELQLTHHFFNYVSYAYTGTVDPEILQCIFQGSASMPSRYWIHWWKITAETWKHGNL